MGTFHELRNVLAAIPDAFRKPEKLPRAERARRLVGVPAHLMELVAVGALRLLPEADDEGREGPRVILIHGYAGHPRSNRLLRRHLRSAGFVADTVDLRGQSSIQEMSDVLQDWLRENVAEGEGVMAVAHSLGGVVLRHALRHDDIRGRLKRIVTLGSPHEGTRIADLVKTVKASQLERDAELTEALEAQEPWHDDLPTLVCLWSRADLMMVPPEAAVADGADARELDDITHYGFLLRQPAWEAVVDSLRDD